MKTQAISYIRFSSKDQAKGDSYRRQLESTEDYCKRKGLTLLDDYSDLGVSAFRGKNQDEGALAEIIHRAKTGVYPKGTILIVESLDRISRQEINKALRLFLEILENGLDIVTLADSERHYRHDKTEMIDLIISLTILSRAHEESQLKSQRIRESLKNKRKEAKETGKVMTSVCPSWLKVENEKFKPIPERVKLIKEVFRMSIEDNMGSHQIATALNERGITPWETNWTTNKTGLWSKTYISKILTSKAVIGTHQPKRRTGNTFVNIGEPIENYFPAIIDEDTFNRNLAKREKRKLMDTGRPAKYKNYNMFRGLVNCANCGNSMVYSQKGSKNKIYHYFKCSGNCGTPTVRFERFELLALRSLPSIDLRGFEKENAAIIARNETREGKIIELKASLKTLRDKWNAGNSPTILDLIEETESKIEAIKSEMEQPTNLNEKSLHDRIKEVTKNLSNEDHSWRIDFRQNIVKLIKEINFDTEHCTARIDLKNGDKILASYDGENTRTTVVKG